MRLNLFHGLPNKREVWAWSMFDLANQSFALLINTLFFSVYFKSRVVAEPDRGDSLWGWAVGLSSLAFVLASPVLGAVADYTSRKKESLFVFYVLSVAFTCSLALAEPNAVTLAFALYFVANFSVSAGEVFIASFLPEISNARNIGRISAIGWTTGYVGALIVLPLTLLITGLDDFSDADYKRVFFFAGVWMLLTAIPTFLFLKERPLVEKAPERHALLTIGFTRLAETLRSAAHYKHLLRFLLCFLVFGAGVQTVIYFAGIIAKDDFGFSDAKRTIFLLQLTIAAGAGAIGVGMFQDRIGRRFTILILLVVWAVCSLGAALTPTRPEYEWAFWVVGNGIGFGLGGVGTASRAFVGFLTPRHKTAEFFGLWGLTWRLGAVTGPPAFGLIKRFVSDQAALLALALVFVVGFLGLLFVDERRGHRAALRAERTARGVGIGANHARADA